MSALDFQCMVRADCPYAVDQSADERQLDYMETGGQQQPKVGTKGEQSFFGGRQTRSSSRPLGAI